MSKKRQKRYRLRKILTDLYINSLAHDMIKSRCFRTHETMLELIDILSDMDDPGKAQKQMIDFMVGFAAWAAVYEACDAPEKLSI